MSLEGRRGRWRTRSGFGGLGHLRYRNPVLDWTEQLVRTHSSMTIIMLPWVCCSVFQLGHSSSSCQLTCCYAHTGAAAGARASPHPEPITRAAVLVALSLVTQLHRRRQATTAASSGSNVDQMKPISRATLTLYVRSLLLAATSSCCTFSCQLATAACTGHRLSAWHRTL